jgi:hypothetical protein
MSLCYMKWLWNYDTKREALWRLVLNTKSDSMSGLNTKSDSMSGDWCSKEVVGPFGVGVWKYIRWGWGVFRVGGKWVQDKVLA